MNEEPLPGFRRGICLRDEYDLILLRLAANRLIPILGICRGHQMVNLAFGGHFFQDIVCKGRRADPTQSADGARISVAFDRPWNRARISCATCTGGYGCS
jgi:gamma-glutamyl-gamma-aminobutyrate hydrolase PuuD